MIPPTEDQLQADLDAAVDEFGEHGSDMFCLIGIRPDGQYWLTRNVDDAYLIRLLEFTLESFRSQQSAEPRTLN